MAMVVRRRRELEEWRPRELVRARQERSLEWKHLEWRWSGGASGVGSVGVVVAIGFAGAFGGSGSDACGSYIERDGWAIGAGSDDDAEGIALPLEGGAERGMGESCLLLVLEGGDGVDGAAGTDGGSEGIRARSSRSRSLKRGEFEAGTFASGGGGGSGQVEMRLRAAALREPISKTSAERVLPEGEIEQ